MLHLTLKGRIIGKGYLRSDAKPNFTDAVYRKPSELSFITKRPVITITRLVPILRAIDLMVSNKIRRLPVTEATGKLTGIVTATNIINFLGGGEYFNIIKVKHKGSFYSAIYEPVDSISTRDVVKAYDDESFTDVLERMVTSGIGAIPVVTRDEKIYGIITERDVLRYIADIITTRKVEDVMTTDLITVTSGTSIGEAAKLMIKHRVRRLPVVDGGVLQGIIVAMDILRFIGEGHAFRKLMLGDVDEVLGVKVSEVMSKNIYSIQPKATVGEAARAMMDAGVGALLVKDDGDLIGIVTERDLLLALALR